MQTKERAMKKNIHSRIKTKFPFFVMEGSLVEHFQNLQFLLILDKNLKQFLYFQSRGRWCSRLECSPRMVWSSNLGREKPKSRNR